MRPKTRFLIVSLFVAGIFACAAFCPRFAVAKPTSGGADSCSNNCSFGGTTIFSQESVSGRISGSVASGSVQYSELQGARFVTNGGVDTRYISDDGTNMTLTGSVQLTNGGLSFGTGTSITGPATSNSFRLLGAPTDGAAAVGVSIGTNVHLATDGALASRVLSNALPIVGFPWEGTVRLNMQAIAQPTCALGRRGELSYVPGAAGVADKLQVCAKSAADAYAWIDVATPIP